MPPVLLALARRYLETQRPWRLGQSGGPEAWFTERMSTQPWRWPVGEAGPPADLPLGGAWPKLRDVLTSDPMERTVLQALYEVQAEPALAVLLGALGCLRRGSGLAASFLEGALSPAGRAAGALRRALARLGSAGLVEAIDGEPEVNGLRLSARLTSLISAWPLDDGLGLSLPGGPDLRPVDVPAEAVGLAKVAWPDLGRGPRVVFLEGLTVEEAEQLALLDAAAGRGRWCWVAGPDVPWPVVRWCATLVPGPVLMTAPPRTRPPEELPITVMVYCPEGPPPGVDAVRLDVSPGRLWQVAEAVSQGLPEGGHGGALEPSSPSRIVAAARLMAAGADAPRLSRVGAPTSDPVLRRVEEPEVPLVVHPATRAQLDGLAELITGRDLAHEGYRTLSGGRGLAVLLYGERSVMPLKAAAIVARLWGEPLYQVDVSMLLSKYIGETERRIATLFDRAERGGFGLFLDHAQSLLPPRTSTRASSGDKYSTMQTGYLMGRIEDFGGLMFLRADRQSEIDPAARRRMSYKVEFKRLDAQGRAALWRALVPEHAPVDEGMDWTSLGERLKLKIPEMELAICHAAVAAAARRGELSMDDIVAAARR